MSRDIVIGPGSRVVLHLRILLEDGTTFEDTRTDGEPISLVIGDGSLATGLEQALFGLAAGEHRRVRLPPEQAFGFPSQENVHVMPRDAFPPNLKIEAGKAVGFTTPTGEEVAGTVCAVDKDTVTVDFNHPLAGQPVVLEAEVLSLEGKGVFD